MPPARLLIGAVAGAALALSAGCAQAADSPASATSPAPSPAASATTSAAATAPQPAPTASRAPRVHTIPVTVRGGRTVDTPARVQVRAGEPVRLVVTTDAADEIHVHGSDEEVELRPGRPATIDFTPRQTGQFEVELHESGLLLFQLLVR